MERGVIIGKTANGRTYYISSSREVVRLTVRDGQKYMMGDCMEFLTKLYTGRSETQSIDRLVTEYRLCPKFVDFKMQENSRSCLLICDVTNVEEKMDEVDGGIMRVIRTDFLEKVFDFRRNGATAKYLTRELLQMRIVCKRVNDRNRHEDYWIAIGVVPKDSNRVRNNNSYTKDSAVSVSRSIESGNRRNRRDKYEKARMKGFVCTIAASKQLFVWVPYNNRDIVIHPQILEKPHTNGRLYGRWISFYVNRFEQIDKYSCIKIIDDVMPTRKNGNIYEIRMPCFFDPEEWNGSDYPVLESYEGGKIADATRVLQRYGRLGGFVDEEAWVYTYFMFDRKRRIRFVLSDKQDQWNIDDNDGQKRLDYQMNRERLQSPVEDGSSDREYEDRYQRRRDDDYGDGRPDSRNSGYTSAYGYDYDGNRVDYKNGRKRSNSRDRYNQREYDQSDEEDRNYGALRYDNRRRSSFNDQKYRNTQSDDGNYGYYDDGFDDNWNGRRSSSPTVDAVRRYDKYRNNNNTKYDRNGYNCGRGSRNYNNRYRRGMSNTGRHGQNY